MQEKQWAYGFDFKNIVVHANVRLAVRSLGNVFWNVLVHFDGSDTLRVPQVTRSATPTCPSELSLSEYVAIV